MLPGVGHAWRIRSEQESGISSKKKCTLLFGILTCYCTVLTFLQVSDFLGSAKQEAYGGYPIELIEAAGLSPGDAQVVGALRDAASSNPLYHLFDGFGSDGISKSLAYLDSGRLIPQNGAEQAAAAFARTQQAYDPAGRCPLLSASSRMEAAKEVGGRILQLFQAQAEARAWIWKDGEHRPLNPAIDQSLDIGRVWGLPFNPTWDRVANALAMFAMLPAFVLTDHGNRTTFFNNVAWASCWEPVPFYYGPMVFKYSEVFPRLVNPLQARGFYAATAPESTNYFSRSMIIFLDGEKHRKVRRLLNHAGFARRYPIDLELVRSITASGDDMPSVVAATAPTLFKGLWGAVPNAEVMKAIQTYGEYGKFAIFGERIDEVLSPAGLTKKIMDARESMTDWASATPFVQVLLAARGDIMPGDSEFVNARRLVQDITDLSAFAGLLGTTDMVHKCVLNQRKDEGHKRLFRADPEKYLIELMRLDSAVTSVTELLRKAAPYILEGRNITLDGGTPVQLVLATANRDPVQFVRPEEFDPSRSNLGDTLAWNGRAQDVEARDEERAPRHCQGFCLSIKVAAAVCAKMTGSFEDLLAKGKVGGKIRCNNFQHEAGKGDNKPLWKPPLMAAYPIPKAKNMSFGETLVKADSYCNGESLYLGHAKTVQECTQEVEWAGGRYFNYGKGWFRKGACYLVYTSDGCPEGFTSSSYDFYDIPSMRDWLKCTVDVVNVSLINGPRKEAAMALLYKEQYTDPQYVTLLTYSERRPGGLLLHRPQVCSVEERLHCFARQAEVRLWQSCCTLGLFSTTCEPDGKFKMVGPAPKPEENSLLWSSQWTNYVQNYRFDPDTDPRLPDVPRPSVEASIASETHTLEQVFDSCPTWIKTAIQAFGEINSASYRYYYRYVPDGARDHPLAKMLGKSPESSIMDPTVFGTYTMGMVVTSMHLMLKRYSGRKLPPAERMAMPSRQAFTDRYVTFSFIGSPTMDIDRGTSPCLTNSLGCIFDAFRKFSITDELTSGKNEWWRILGGDFLNLPHQCPNNAANCTKKEFIRGIFSTYTTEDGDPVYPVQQFDLAGLFRRGGRWADEAERFYAFNHLGAHQLRIPHSRPSKGGETAAYYISTSDIAGLSLRPNFATPGADMYFSREGLPIMIRSPQGGDVWKHQVDEETWQYWKFHWRSSLFLRVTLIDHLYTTHFAVGGMLAASAREGLPANHGLRRLLTMFTWNTIGVNDDAMHQLIGSQALLHRSTPFHDWEEVIKIAQANVPTLQERYGAFFGDGVPEELAHVPYYQDGQLLADAMKYLVGNWTRLYAAEWCSSDGLVKDQDIKFFFKSLWRWKLDPYNFKDNNEWLHMTTPEGEVTCSGMEKFLSMTLFGVTGFHRQVGQIGDVGVDANFATWSWREGEPYGLPRQHLDMALVVAFTAKIMPKIDQDYSFLAQGLAKEKEAAEVLRTFQASMVAIAAEIDQRNAKREYPYFNMHPSQVECSVAV